MALDDFIEDLESEDSADESTDNESNNEQTKEDSGVYTGNEDLNDPSASEIEEVLESTDLNFRTTDLPLSSTKFACKSDDGKFEVLLSLPSPTSLRDSIRVEIVESESLYDVVEPYDIFPTEGWKRELVDVMNGIKEKKDGLVYCPRCDSVMIRKTTLTNGKLIRGCSSFPDCRYSENLL